MFGNDIRKDDEENFEREKKYAEMYKNFCKHLLEELNEEYERVESDIMINRDGGSYHILKSWNRKIVEIAKPIRDVYKSMNEFLAFCDDEFLRKKYI